MSKRSGARRTLHRRRGVLTGTARATQEARRGHGRASPDGRGRAAPCGCSIASAQYCAAHRRARNRVRERRGRATCVGRRRARARGRDRAGASPHGVSPQQRQESSRTRCPSRCRTKGGGFAQRTRVLFSMAAKKKTTKRPAVRADQWDLRLYIAGDSPRSRSAPRTCSGSASPPPPPPPPLRLRGNIHDRGHRSDQAP